MAVEILMPKLGLTMKTGTVTKWLKEEGDSVVEKEPLLEMETEKLTNVIPAPASGVLVKKIGVVGEKYPIAFVLGYIGDAGETIDKTPDAPAPEKAGEAATACVNASSKAPAPGNRIFISPLAKKLAAQQGIDYSMIKGSGPNGRIVKADIENYAANSAKAAVTTPVPPAPPCVESQLDDEIVPYSGIRKAIGDKMYKAWNEIPMVTHNVTADASRLVSFRTALNTGVTDKKDRVSVNDIIIKLTAAALEKKPIINSSLTERGIEIHKAINVGMATAIDNGLLVPVVHNANKKSLLQISAECKNLAQCARSGRLLPENMQGGTFTVTNLGGYGSVDSFSPIINTPEHLLVESQED